MKRNIYYMCLAVLLGIAVLLFASCTATGYPPQDASEQGFSCYTVDRKGETIHGYFHETENKWYLFVPSVEKISDIKLCYSGEVASASEGKLNEKKQRISGAFSQSGDSVTLTLEGGETVSVVVMQSKLPSVQVNLSGKATLDTVHANKDISTRIDRIRISNPTGQYNLNLGGSAEIKGRGNTTWSLYDKKAYQIRFDSKLSVLGMEPAKKWVLLANAGDDSLMRNQLVYRMAKNLDMEFVPSLEYVDLWVNGEYLGTYMLGEKIELDRFRLDLAGEDAALFEHDESYYSTEELWFYNEVLRRHFTVKDINVEREDFITAAVERFDASVSGLMKYLFFTPSKEVTLEALSEMIDVDSFAKYYLINEYVLNCESYATSFFWYQDGEEDVLHLGPVWDFDTCMGNDSCQPTDSYGSNHTLFSYLLAAPEFYKRTEELHEQYREYLHAMTDDTDTLREQIAESAAMNWLRWDPVGGDSMKPHAAEFNRDFDQSVRAVKNWLSLREKHFEITECSVVTSTVSSDYSAINVRFDDGKPHTAVKFAIWNYDHSDISPTLWGDGELIDGAWQCAFDLTDFNLAGVYRIDVYVDNYYERAETTGRSFVAKLPAYQIKTERSPDGKTLSVSMEDSGDDCLAVRFAVWSEANNQADIVWVEAEEDSAGRWNYTIDATQLSEEETYIIHAYGRRTGEEYEFLNGALVPGR